MADFITHLRNRYVDLIGYDPFAPDGGWTWWQVVEILNEYDSGE